MRRILARLISSLRRQPANVTQTSPYMTHNPDYRNYSVGEWSYGRPTILSWGEGAELRIGRFCSIAEGVTILLGGEHRIDWITTYPFSALLEEARVYRGHPRTKGDVMIGNDVWIGQGAMILSGVKIGDGAVVGAGSVVTRDVAAYSVVAGNPARRIRFRFADGAIEALQAIAWWDWPLWKIREAWPLLLSSDIEAFLQEYGGGRRGPAASKESRS